MWRTDDNLQNQFFHQEFTWNPGIEFKPSDLVEGAFTHWANFPASLNIASHTAQCPMLIFRLSIIVNPICFESVIQVASGIFCHSLEWGICDEEIVSINNSLVLGMLLSDVPCTHITCAFCQDTFHICHSLPEDLFHRPDGKTSFPWGT